MSQYRRLSEEPVVAYDEGSLCLRTLSCPPMPLLGGEEPEGSQRLVIVVPPSLRELEVLEDSSIP